MVPRTCYSGLTLSKRIVRKGEICLLGLPITRVYIGLMSKRAREQTPSPEAFAASWRRLRYLHVLEVWWQTQTSDKA